MRRQLHFCQVDLITFGAGMPGRHLVRVHPCHVSFEVFPRLVALSAGGALDGVTAAAQVAALHVVSQPRLFGKARVALLAREWFDFHVNRFHVGPEGVTALHPLPTNLKETSKFLSILVYLKIDFKTNTT